jgi:hypothetical protein
MQAITLRMPSSGQAQSSVTVAHPRCDVGPSNSNN